MSELLKTTSEKSAESSEASHLEVLTEIADDFDPDKAKALIEQDRPKTLEKQEVPESTLLMTLPENQEKELSPDDAANEYLSLLDELSQDFTNTHYAGGITKDLGRKYSENPHYHWEGYAGTEVDANDKTMLRIASADAILANEIGWRNEGEKAGVKIEQIDQSLADLDANYSKKSILGQFFGKRKYEKAKKELEDSKQVIEYQFNKNYNEKIANELSKSYNGDAKNNEELNRQFFGLDNPERAAKVERAIELRQKYESEWTKEK